MRTPLSTFGLQATLLTSLLASPLGAQTASYTIIDIGDLAPAGSHDATNATGMNELGHVAASTGDGTNSGIPVLYRDGELIPLGSFPGEHVGGAGKGVNNLDQVVGWSLNAATPFPGHQSEPFLWTESGGMLNPIDDLPINYSGESWGVNDAGQVALNLGGCSFYDPVAGFTQIHFPGQPANSGVKAWEINEDGVVAGSARNGTTGQGNAFRYDSATDTITNLNDPVADFKSEAYGLNDLGDIAGWAMQPGPAQSGVVWTADGQTLRLPVGELGVNQISGTAEHMNNHGDVVGLDSFPGASGGHPDFQPIGWVALEATQASRVVKTDLLSLVSPTDAAYWRSLHPFEINDRGEIGGIGVAEQWIDDGSGGARGFLMVPNTPDRFRNLSRSVRGVNGHPVLIAKGTLEAGTPLDIGLYKAAPHANGYLMVGLDTLYAPLQGGVLVPDIFSAGGGAFLAATDGNGATSIAATWPSGVPANVDLVLQYWIADAAALLGYAASNAIIQTTP